jgi:hypothetical protein
VGATVVLLGIVVVLLPTFFAGPGPGQGAGSGAADQLLWVVVMISSCVPMALSSVYKEVALGECDIGAWSSAEEAHLLTWCCIQRLGIDSG